MMSPLDVVTVSHNPDVNDDGDIHDETDLRKSYERLEERVEKLEKMLDSARSENSQLRGQLEELEKRNESLKSNPLFVGTVKETLKDTKEIIIKKHGDNQEFIVEDPDRYDLEPGDRVSLNDTMSVTSVISESETDARAQAMELDEDPDVTYEDIGGLDDQLKEIREATEDPILNSEKFNDVGIEPPSGVLLHGPPGTGKTMMAKAVANKTDATFLKLAASELAQKFIGEGARLVRDLFEVATENAPTIIFIDEIDAIATKRSRTKSDGGAEIQRTLMQLLSEMDGFDNRSDIRIIGATNRFDMLDEAVLRPGRFDRTVEVPEPSEDGRKQVFKIHSSDMNIRGSVNYNTLAEQTEKFTGADIQATCTEAGMIAIRNDRDYVVTDDFIEAIELVKTDDSNPVMTRAYQ